MFKVLILVTIFFLPSLVNALDYSPEGEVTGMYAGNDNTIGVFHSAAICSVPNYHHTISQISGHTHRLKIDRFPTLSS